MYEDRFSEIERFYGLPEGILSAVMQVESSGGKHTLNPASMAMGPFQITPIAAREYGIKNPYDIDESSEAAARMLSDYMRRFGSIDSALAAYNWGPTNVAKKGTAKLPDETAEYIKKVKNLLPAPEPTAQQISQEPEETKEAKKSVKLPNGMIVNDIPSDVPDDVIISTLIDKGLLDKKDVLRAELKNKFTEEFIGMNPAEKGMAAFDVGISRIPFAREVSSALAALAGEGAGKDFKERYEYNQAKQEAASDVLEEQAESMGKIPLIFGLKAGPSDISTFGAESIGVGTAGKAAGAIGLESLLPKFMQGSWFTNVPMASGLYGAYSGFASGRNEKERNENAALQGIIGLALAPAMDIGVRAVKPIGRGIKSVASSAIGKIADPDSYLGALGSALQEMSPEEKAAKLASSELSKAMTKDIGGKGDIVAAAENIAHGAGTGSMPVTYAGPETYRLGRYAKISDEAAFDMAEKLGGMHQQSIDDIISFTSGKQDTGLGSVKGKIKELIEDIYGNKISNKPIIDLKSAEAKFKAGEALSPEEIAAVSNLDELMKSPYVMEAMDRLKKNINTMKGVQYLSPKHLYLLREETENIVNPQQGGIAKGEWDALKERFDKILLDDPEYRRATSAYFTQKTIEEAMNDGAKMAKSMLSSSGRMKPVSQIEKDVKSLAEKNKAFSEDILNIINENNIGIKGFDDAYKAGAIETIIKEIHGSLPTEGSVGETGKLYNKLFGSKENFEKLKFIMGEENALELRDSLRYEKALMDMYKNVREKLGINPDFLTTAKTANLAVREASAGRVSSIQRAIATVIMPIFQRSDLSNPKVATEFYKILMSPSPSERIKLARNIISNVTPRDAEILFPLMRGEALANALIVSGRALKKGIVGTAARQTTNVNEIEEKPKEVTND